jgi:excinuclease ABC subunit A
VPFIHIEGAREHNLKNIALKIPRGKLTAVTGVSGSGKSSLAFDTLFAEGQRQFIATLSFRTSRQFRQLRRPDVDAITGLPPTVAVDQRGRMPNRRSTVATLTEVYDYLRLLYARCGSAHCYQCGQPIQRQSIQQILDTVLRLPEGSRLILLAPVVCNEPGTHQNVFQRLVKAGFIRCRIDGGMRDIETLPELAAQEPHHIEAVIDRLVVKDSIRDRLWESLQLALKEGSDTAVVSLEKDKNVWQDIAFSTRYACPQCRISYLELEPRTFSFNSPYGACPLCEGIGTLESQVCPECSGSRLRREARSVTVDDKRIDEIGALTLDEALAFFATLQLPEEKRDIAEPLLEQIQHRLTFLNGIGLDYLTLDRRSDTLSGGEYQRVRLATALGSGLTGVCYILDEPSIGLHSRDNQRLIECLLSLRDQGNTVIVVEHDDSLINAAENVIEIGPGAGRYGGKIIYEGQKKFAIDNGEWEMKTEDGQRNGFDSNTHSQFPSLTVHDASLHNLKDLTVSFPLQKLICVTGVSGSGKSSLVNETLVPLVRYSLQGGRTEQLSFAGGQLDKLIVIDQSPLGRSGRGNAATYCGVFGEIRKLFAETKDAKRRGYKASRFSFNSSSGRCEYCRGHWEWKMEDGEWKIKMENGRRNVLDSNLQISVFNSRFLCPMCGGKRFNRQTLAVKYRGMSIADVLDMTMDEAAEFFSNFQTISRLLQGFQKIGLGYLTLGQPSSKLSGGEAQRVKLATELAKVETGKTLYVLDEPTTGLHRTDVARLMDVLCGLVERGNTVITVEHNLDVIRRSDYLIELGPGGGKSGGYITNIMKR